MSLAFLLTSLVSVATPGTGASYTIAAGLSRGTRAGIIAAAGCTLGIVPHLAAAITGTAALLRQRPGVRGGEGPRGGVPAVHGLDDLAGQGRVGRERGSAAAVGAADRGLGGAGEPAEPEADDLLLRLPPAVRARRRRSAGSADARAQRCVHGDDVRGVRAVRGCSPPRVAPGCSNGRGSSTGCAAPSPSPSSPLGPSSPSPSAEPARRAEPRGSLSRISRRTTTEGPDGVDRGLRSVDSRSAVGTTSCTQGRAAGPTSVAPARDR